MTKLKTKQRQAKIQIAEAIRQDALLFVDRLKALSKDGITVEGINQIDIMAGFKHSEAYNSLSAHYQSKVPTPLACAANQGLISISREGNKPYTYKIQIEKQQGKITLRPYQSDIVDQAAKAKGSVLIELPTGGGKSVIAKEVIKHETDKGGIALIVAPKITLLDQLANTFDELQPQIIHGAKDYDSGHNVFVSTLQTAYKRKLGFTPTMILIDETHYGFTGKMIKQLLDSFKGKVVGLSATPYDKQGKPLEGFKTHLNDYNMDYMITNGYLVPIISYQPVKVNLKGIRTTAGDYNIQDLDQKFNTIESVMQVVDATKQKIIDRKQALVFCITIKHAEAMAKAYNDAGIKSLAIHSQLSNEAKAEAMAAFKSGAIKVLTNADMLTTGFDHPPTDTIILARATKSQNLYKQMVGRVLRLAPNKTEAVLLDCAGVISNLGLPTAPIRPKHDYEAIEAGKSVCSECESERVYRTIKNDQVYKVCAECGHHEVIESQSGYECEECGQVHGNNADFMAMDGKLLLKCGCGHYTVISEATSHEKLKAIFDKRMVETLKRRVSAAYCTALISKYGVDFIYRNEVKRQLEALNIYIGQHPENATGGTLEKIIARMKTSPDEWRLLDKYHEDKLLPESSIAPDTQRQNIKDLESAFYRAKGFANTIDRLNALLQAKGQQALKEWVIDKTMQQLNDSHIEGIEAMTVKRLKNLYSGGKDTNSIDAFVPYIEKQRGTGDR
ncbi:DEAD/DEAH box helicase [Sulfurovum riftiae]|uniref:Helicase n=1 Tax=Sulfurovum riftiae TaxID=1630136 RepID=A0A151CDR3_9BACT|nr:DEAD/DEAH box helicase family protein [Sulfurovum riftiae]KYJ85660.1 hypothetical protein AS592_01095 [Sulfurovum riftiae]